MDYSNFSIETEDLILRKARFEDWPHIYDNLWRHEESARYMLWSVTTSEEEAIDRINRTIAFQSTNKYTFFIVEKESNEVIGFAGMKEIEPGVFEDMGVGLGPQYTGKGYGTQVLNALLNEVSSNGGHKFIATCWKQNIASKRLQERLGFCFVKEEMRTDPRTGKDYIMLFSEKTLP